MQHGVKQFLSETEIVVNGPEVVRPEIRGSIHITKLNEVNARTVDMMFLSGSHSAEHIMTGYQLTARKQLEWDCC